MSKFTIGILAALIVSFLTVGVDRLYHEAIVTTRHGRQQGGESDMAFRGSGQLTFTEKSIDKSKSLTTSAIRKGHLVIARESHLVLLRPDGKEERRLMKLTTSGDISKGIIPGGFRFAHDGQRIAFLQYDDTVEPPKVVLLVQNLKDSKQDQSIALSGEPFSFYWCWSPNGHNLAVSSLHTTCDKEDAAVIDCRVAIDNHIIDLRRGETVTVPLSKEHLITDWSPDGKWFLTTSLPHTIKLNTKMGRSPVQLTKINLVRTDGSRINCISNPEASSDSGRFSPDGRSILFIKHNEDMTGQVFVIGLHGGKARAVTPEKDGRVIAAVWSPDGTQIAYLWSKGSVQAAKGSEPNDFDVFLKLIDANGGKPTVLIVEKSSLRDLAFPILDWR